jgi:hypothetical protein
MQPAGHQAGLAVRGTLSQVTAGRPADVARFTRALQRTLNVGGDFMMLSTFKTPSAWVPLAMSGGALAVVTAHILNSGVAPEANEGAAAHMWQLLMAGQVPIIAWFLLRWFPKGRAAAAPVLAAQALALLAAAAPVALLGL